MTLTNPQAELYALQIARSSPILYHPWIASPSPLMRTLTAIAALAVSISLLSSCASETKLQADRPALAKMQRLGIVVTKEEEFSVRVAREERPVSVNFGYTGGGSGLSLMVLGAVAISRAIDDSGYMAQVKPALKTYDAAEHFAESFRRHLQGDGGFAAVAVISGAEPAAAHARGLDGVVQVTLKQWGLRRCGGAEGEELAQVGFYIEGRVLSAANGENVWERREFYVDGECRAVRELSEEGLLVKALARSVDYLSGKMANEIRFP